MRSRLIVSRIKSQLLTMAYIICMLCASLNVPLSLPQCVTSSSLAGLHVPQALFGSDSLHMLLPPLVFSGAGSFLLLGVS